MAKTVNITDKLEFNSNPVMEIGTLEVEVKADAETMLKLIGTFAENGELTAVGKAMDLIFDPEDVKKICKLNRNGRKLSAKSLMVIVQEAMNLVMGEENEQGEQ